MAVSNTDNSEPPGLTELGDRVSLVYLEAQTRLSLGCKRRCTAMQMKWFPRRAIPGTVRFCRVRSGRQRAQGAHVRFYEALDNAAACDAAKACT